LWIGNPATLLWHIERSNVSDPRLHGGISMKSSTTMVASLASFLLFVAAPSAAFAGTDLPIVPEPSAMLIWAGLAGAGGLAYWSRNRRAK
jgi:hypothetical protein